MKHSDAKSSRTILRILSLAALLGVVCACAFLYFHYGKTLVGLLEDTDRFKAWIGRFGPWGAVVFTAVRTAQTVVKFIPAEPLEIGSGLVFGAFGGTALCLLGSVLGSVVILFLSRKLGTRVLELFRLENKLQSMRFLQDRKKRNLLLFVIFLIPGSPKDVITYFVGLTDANLIEFMILGSIARIPSIVSSTICGAFLGQKNFPLSLGIFAATTVLSILGAVAYKKIAARYAQHKDRDESPQEDEM